jgi:hypothetical protein
VRVARGGAERGAPPGVAAERVAAREREPAAGEREQRVGVGGQLGGGERGVVDGDVAPAADDAHHRPRVAEGGGAGLHLQPLRGGEPVAPAGRVGALGVDVLHVGHGARQHRAQQARARARRPLAHDEEAAAQPHHRARVGVEVHLAAEHAGAGRHVAPRLDEHAHDGHAPPAGAGHRHRVAARVAVDALAVVGERVDDGERVDGGAPGPRAARAPAGGARVARPRVAFGVAAQAQAVAVEHRRGPAGARDGEERDAEPRLPRPVAHHVLLVEAGARPAERARHLLHGEHGLHPRLAPGGHDELGLDRGAVAGEGGRDAVPERRLGHERAQCGRGVGGRVGHGDGGGDRGRLLGHEGGAGGRAAGVYAWRSAGARCRVACAVPRTPARPPSRPRPCPARSPAPPEGPRGPPPASRPSPPRRGRPAPSSTRSPSPACAGAPSARPTSRGGCRTSPPSRRRRARSSWPAWPAASGRPPTAAPRTARCSTTSA